MSDLILILDDELSYATMLGDLLDEHGYQTDICTQPREALERLQHKSYGLIVTDYKMPQCDGAEFVTEVRKVLPRIPVIMVSGLMGKPDLLAVANIGVTLVLEKPFDVAAFLECVSKYVDPRSEDDRAPVSALPPVTAGEASGPHYPRPVQHLVDADALTQVFLNELWSRLQASPHCLLVVPPGSEFSLLLAEGQRWIGSNDARLHHFSYGDLGRVRVREQLRRLAAEASAPLLIGLSVPPAMEIDGAGLEDFLRWSQSDETVREKLRFLHALPDLVEVRKMEFPRDLQGVASSPLPWPPLAERMADLAAYAKRMFEAGVERRLRLSSSAVELLLHYDWPGNYEELRSVVHRALAYAAGGELTPEVMRLAIRDRHGEPPPRQVPLRLGDFLLREQRRFLQRHLPSRERTEALARLLGPRFDRLDREVAMEEQPLLFEELAAID
ncbi:MAG: response regulator [Opitutales bacterium]